jgi:fructan beta-fructosidase
MLQPLSAADESAVSSNAAGPVQSTKGETVTLYREKLRPQFHFSTRRGWQNDPNGLVFYKGEYHLFYQHIPSVAHFSPGVSYPDAKAHWGHAVSRDLIHWQELPTALYPDERGAIFSGSAVIDWNNTSGFQKGDEPPMVAFYTSAGEPFNQGAAFSNDRGRTFTKYEGNPVVPNIAVRDRDPKVFWYAPQKKWVMALFIDRSDPAMYPKMDMIELYEFFLAKNSYALFSSPDLKQWTRMSDLALKVDGECPELFEISVDGDPKNTRWIFHGAKGRYLIGKFDGTSFIPESGPHEMQRGNAWYASQTFNDIPASDGRRILIPWASTIFMNPNNEPLYKDMPFNQSMGIPVELTLRATEEGLRLFANPVRELASLRTRSYSLKSQTVRPGENPAAAIKGELLDIETDISPATAKNVVFNLRGVPVTYDAEKQELSCADKKAPLRMQNGRIRLRFLIDRTSVEIFGNEGRLYMAMGVKVPSEDMSLHISAKNGAAVLNSLNAYELKSIWN